MASANSFDSLLEHFSRACQLFNVKPNPDTERPILDVQQMPGALDFCRFVLGNTQDPVVLFHTLRIILSVVIATWSELSPEDILGVKSMVLSFGEVSADRAPPFVLNQAATIYAALTKRSWMTYVMIDGSAELGELKQMMHSEVNRLASASASVSAKTRLFGISVMESLVAEFECSRKASSLEVGAELHSQCFESFEADDLGAFFVTSVSLLIELSTALAAPDQPASSPVTALTSAEQLELLTQTLRLSNHILTWPFGQLAIILGIFIGNTMALMKPPPSWRDILITPNMEVLNLYNNLYNLFRSSNQQIAHLVREGMMQFASLSGDVFGTSEQARAEPRRNWIASLSSLLTGFLGIENMTNSELRDMATIVQRFFGAVSLQFIIDAIGLQNLEIMMQTVSTRTCETMNRLISFAESGSTALEGVDAYDHFDDSDVEDTVLGEALDIWLQAWSAWSSDASTAAFPNLPTLMFEVFSAYVTSRLSIARAELIKSETTEQWVTYETPKGKHDLTNYVLIEQLSSVAAVGRVSPRASLELLRSILSDISGVLRDCVARGESSQEAHIKLEELHWILMIIGHFLCQVNRGEMSYIPISIHRICNIFDEQGEPNQVVQLSSLVFEIIGIENAAIEQAQNTGNLVWSPLVAETLAWFLANWSSCYLLISDLSNSASPSLAHQYGVNSENTAVILDELFRKIVINLTGWGGETDVLLRTCSILQLISRLDTLHMSMLNKLSGFSDLFNAWTSGNATMATFPPKVQRKLMAGLAHLVQTEGVEDQLSYLNMLIEPVDSQFNAIITGPEFNSTYQSPSTMISLQIVFERLRGLLQSTRGRTYKSVNQIVTQYLSTIVELLVIYKDHHQMVLLILKIFRDYVGYVTCCTYDESLLLPFREALTQLLTSAQSVNLFKRRVTGGTTALGARYGAEDAQTEQYEELLTFFGIMCGIVDDKEEEVAKVSFFALSVATPHIDDDMLAFPKLCRRYFHFISSIFGTHAAYLESLDDALFDVVLRALESGLHQVDEYIQMAALDAIAKVASFNFKMMSLKSIDVLQTKHAYLGQFITSLLKWMLFEDGFKTDLMESTSKAFFALICAEEEAYKQTVQMLLETQNDPNIQQRLSELFVALTSGIELQWQEPSKNAFLANMKSFVPITRGILHTK